MHPRNHSVHSATERRLNIVLRHTAKHDTTALKNSIIFFQLLVKGFNTWPRLKSCCGKSVTFTPIFYQLSAKINCPVAFSPSQLSMYCKKCSYVKFRKIKKKIKLTTLTTLRGLLMLFMPLNFDIECYLVLNRRDTFDVVWLKPDSRRKLKFSPSPYHLPRYQVTRTGQIHALDCPCFIHPSPPFPL